MPRARRSPRSRALVELTVGARKRGSRRFAFCYQDIADLFGVSAGAVRLMVWRGRLNPLDLKEICEEWLMRLKTREARETSELIERLFG